MDIQKIISDLVSKLTGNNDLIAKFTSNPLGIIKDLLGIDLDPSLLDEVVKGVSSKLDLGNLAGGLAGNVGKEAEGLLGKVKRIFGK